MAAIITSHFRMLNANNFKDSVADLANSYYLFLGKSDAWSANLAATTDSEAPTPLDTIVEINDAYQNMSALKKITAGDVTNVMPRHASVSNVDVSLTWVSGATYVAWDDQDPDIYSKPYYIITDEYKVYKCIKAGSGTSTNKPVTTATNPVSQGDEYLWKYMYTIATADATKYLTNFYAPVKTVTLPVTTEVTTAGTAGASGSTRNVLKTVGVAGDLSEADQTQYANQNANIAALKGKIYRYIVTNNGGTGYATAPTVTVVGDGTGALATATIAGGVVTGVTVAVSGSGFNTNAGTNYSVANVVLSGGGFTTAATVRAVLSPANGHGSNPVEELGGFYNGLSISLTGAEGADFIVNNSFRQLGIVKNPFTYGTTTVATASTLKALKGMTLTNSSALVIGSYFTGNQSGAVAYLDSWDSASGAVRYHQNDKTGYGTFVTAETITGQSGTGTGVISTLENPEVDRFSGKIIFVENRAAINRSASQIEDIKVITEF